MHNTTENSIDKRTDMYPLGKGLSLRKGTNHIELWQNRRFIFRRVIDPRKKSPEFRMLIVELSQEYKAQKTKLSSVFSISRQSINDWIASYDKHGIVGLINSTKNIGNSHRTKGNKGEANASDIQQKKLQLNKLQLNLEDIKLPKIQDVEPENAPYEKTIEKHNNRYAGVFAMIVLLTSHYAWFNWTIGLFGKSHKIFQVFCFMAAKNIRSIEQLKNVRSKEAGAILGLSKLPSLPGIWAMFYDASKKGISNTLLKLFFKWQLGTSKVSSRFWFTDGHVLPYTGKERVHKVFNTKKREAEPGGISFVTCDFSGRIVDFVLKEGGSGLREHILDLHDKWEENYDKEEYPVHVFDREGDGCGFFYNLTKRCCPFVTWEKNADRKKLYGTDGSEFNKELEFNGIKYLYFEGSKNFVYKENESTEHKFSLRRFGIINTASNKRTSALAFSGHAELSQQDCIYGILNRWGASENTFKHLGDRHPLAYRPGFKLRESEKQTVINPEIKILDKQIKRQEKEYTRLCKDLAAKEKSVNKSGEQRKNGAYGILKTKLANVQEKKQQLKSQKSELPQRIDISGLTDYKNFKKHDNEGKNLFDFVNSISWKARKKGVEMLKGLYPHKNDIVDLFYAIINCAGTVEITENAIKVVLEPLEQSSRRVAQVEFCKKITQLGAQTPFKKKMILSVKKQKTQNVQFLNTNL